MDSFLNYKFPIKYIQKIPLLLFLSSYFLFSSINYTCDIMAISLISATKLYLRSLEVCDNN